MGKLEYHTVRDIVPGTYFRLIFHSSLYMPITMYVCVCILKRCEAMCSEIKEKEEHCGWSTR